MRRAVTSHESAPRHSRQRSIGRAIAGDGSFCDDAMMCDLPSMMKLKTAIATGRDSQEKKGFALRICARINPALLPCIRLPDPWACRAFLIRELESSRSM